MDIVFWIFWCVFTMALVWFLHCNHRTYKQRAVIIDWIFDGTGNYHERSKQFDAVSYDRHLWNLFFFHNPKNLYDFNNCP